MKVLIIEDENLAAERLAKMIKEIQEDAIILPVLVSINSAVDWLRSNPSPDVILLDIHLADGLSFEIFRQVEVTAPVIFTTAYDEHALEAFQVNSIDYLLKPIRKDDLSRAFTKLKRLTSLGSSQLESLIRQLGSQAKDYRKRLVIRYGDTIKMIDMKEVAYFYTQDKINYLCTHKDLRYPIDHNLDELEQMTDPGEFFRINRQFIINIQAIDKMIAWTKSRVKVILRPPTNEDTIVSTERSPHFKEWLNGQ